MQVVESSNYSNSKSLLCCVITYNVRTDIENNFCTEEVGLYFIKHADCSTGLGINMNYLT